MKALVLIVMLPLAAVADTLSITWVQPTTREDGTALPLAEIANYRLSWTVRGVAQPDITVPRGTNYTLDTGTLSGRTCVVMRTVDTDGLESVPTEPACRNARPNPPGNLGIGR